MKPSTYAMTPHRVFNILIVSVLALWLAACTDACQRSDLPDRMPSGPLDRTIARAQARALQDSILAVVPPDTFQAQWHGDPFDPDIEEATFEWQFQGPATFRVDADDEGQIRTVHVTLHVDDPGGRDKIYVNWSLKPRGQPSEEVVGGVLEPGTYVQHDPETFPSANAELAQGRDRFLSRSGTLTITDVADGHMRGSFFFEMLPRSGDSPFSAEENWFSLVGAFDARRAE